MNQGHDEGEEGYLLIQRYFRLGCPLGNHAIAGPGILTSLPEFPSEPFCHMLSTIFYTMPHFGDRCYLASYFVVDWFYADPDIVEHHPITTGRHRSSSTDGEPLHLPMLDVVLPTPVCHPRVQQRSSSTTYTTRPCCASNPLPSWPHNNNLVEYGTTGTPCVIVKVPIPDRLPSCGVNERCILQLRWTYRTIT